MASDTAYSYFAAEYFFGVMPVMGTCAGTESAAIFGCAILTSYLFLFIVRCLFIRSSLVIKLSCILSTGQAFYQKTYKKVTPAAKQDAIKTE